MMKKCRFGFTLAEVLIVISVIGVVTALTLPNLLHNNYVRKTVSQLTETYSIMSQAVSASCEDNGDPEGWGITGRDAKSATIIAEKLKPYLKISLDCGVEGYNRKCSPYYRNRILSDWSNPVKDTRNLVSDYRFILANGSTIYLAGADSSHIPKGMLIYIQVDTNGKAQPNKWGVDLFEFTYIVGKGLVPSGNPNVPNGQECENRQSSGYGCAYYVLTHRNMDYLRK